MPSGSKNTKSGPKRIRPLLVLIFLQIENIYFLQPTLTTAGEHDKLEEIFFQEVSRSCQAGHKRERDAGRACRYACQGNHVKPN